MRFLYNAANFGIHYTYLNFFNEGDKFKCYNLTKERLNIVQSVAIIL